MTAKEYLSKIQTYRAAAESANERLEELYHQAEGIRAIVYDKDRVQVSPENRFEEVMVKIDAEAEKLSKLMLKYMKAVRVRTEQIAAMDNTVHAKVLTLRYIDGKRWEEIACIMNYSFRHVTRLHGDALAEFGRMYKDVLLCPRKR